MLEPAGGMPADFFAPVKVHLTSAEFDLLMPIKSDGTPLEREDPCAICMEVRSSQTAHTPSETAAIPTAAC